MWNEPTPKLLDCIPRFHEMDGIELPDKLVWAHFFLSGCDWWILEYDPEDRLFYGYARLGGMEDCAEWGYTSFDELRQIEHQGMQVDFDLHWKVRPVSEISEISYA